MNDSALTLIIVVFTAIIAFVVAKVAPTLQEEEKKCPPRQEQFSFWRLLRGTMLIRREQITEELFEEIPPPKGK